jgi:hypothetical protein
MRILCFNIDDLRKYVSSKDVEIKLFELYSNPSTDNITVSLDKVLNGVY